MYINIYGSTGIIGRKTLTIIKNYFPNIKINLLCAKSNVNLLIKQIHQYKPRYVYIHDKKKSKIIKSKIKNNTRILEINELFDYLKNSKSNYSLLAISGYKSLHYLDHIINNTSNIGIATKEAIVSAGHIFKKKKYFNKTNIFPLDSEHFSLFEFFNQKNNLKNIKKVTITASGGPFYKSKFSSLKNIKFEKAIKHPKWKMGYKNSIDSATLVNKCLELIEAHYLFNIPFTKLDVKIHPEAVVHSIVQKDNFVFHMNLFKNDMDIPISNFLRKNNKSLNLINKDLEKFDYSKLHFLDVKYTNFPIFKLFLELDKDKPENFIKFNIGNEFAVNLFKNRKIRYTDIYTIIKKATSLNLYSSLNNIKDIIDYHENFENELQALYRNII